MSSARAKHKRKLYARYTVKHARLWRWSYCGKFLTATLWRRPASARFDFSTLLNS